MRLVRVKAPAGKGAQVAQVAFDVGVSEVSIFQVRSHKSDGSEEVKDAIDVDTSTPKAKAFVDALMKQSFFAPGDYSVAVRQPRTIVSSEAPRNLTRPIVLPTLDLFEDLWQFSHVTVSFVVRVLIAGMLLAFGLVQSSLLFMIAGLLFLQFLPMLLAVGFGLWTRQWRLVGQGFLAFLVAAILLTAGGALVGLMTEPPIKFQESNSLLTGFLVSLAVGVAAGFATTDDVGRREMLGLAATAQIAIIPTWLGISLVFGFSPLESTTPQQRLLSFAVNVLTIVVASCITYALLGMRGEAINSFTGKLANEG